jgi:hypothetical protein
MKGALLPFLVVKMAPVGLDGGNDFAELSLHSGALFGQKFRCPCFDRLVVLN